MSSQPSKTQEEVDTSKHDHPLRQRLEEYLDVAPLSGNPVGDFFFGERHLGDAVKLPDRLHSFLRETVSTIIRIERTQESIQDNLDANAREQQELKQEIAALRNEIEDLQSETATVKDIETLLDEKTFATDDNQDDSE